MKNSKIANIVYRQMPAPQELSQQIPAPRQKLGCKSPRVGANFWCKSPGVRGGMVMDEIDTCIRGTNFVFTRHISDNCWTGRFYTTDELSVWTNQEHLISSPSLSSSSIKMGNRPIMRHNFLYLVIDRIRRTKCSDRYPSVARFYTGKFVRRTIRRTKIELA